MAPAIIFRMSRFSLPCMNLRRTDRLRFDLFRHYRLGERCDSSKAADVAAFGPHSSSLAPVPRGDARGLDGQAQEERAREKRGQTPGARNAHGSTAGQRQDARSQRLTPPTNGLPNRWSARRKLERDRRLHDRPTLAPRVTRSSSSCANDSGIPPSIPATAASRASFEG